MLEYDDDMTKQHIKIECRGAWNVFDTPDGVVLTADNLLLSVPESARLESLGGRICWTWPKTAKLVRPKPTLWRDFARLGDASDDEIVSFAGRWGPLDFARLAESSDAERWPLHGPKIKDKEKAARRNLARQIKAAASNTEISAWRNLAAQIKAVASGKEISAWCNLARQIKAVASEEEIADWRNLARQINAVANIAERLKQDDIGTAAEWGPIVEDLSLDIQLLQGKYDTSLRWMIVTRFVNRLYSKCQNHSILSLVGRMPKLVPHAGGVAGAVLIQLAHKLRGGLDVWRCCNCHRRLESGGLPRRGERRYCPSCRKKGVPARDAARAYRARRKLKGSFTG